MSCPETTAVQPGPPCTRKVARDRASFHRSLRPFERSKAAAVFVSLWYERRRSAALRQWLLSPLSYSLLQRGQLGANAMRVYNRIGEITDPTWYAEETKRRERETASPGFADDHPIATYILIAVVCGVFAALAPWFIFPALFFAFIAELCILGAVIMALGDVLRLAPQELNGEGLFKRRRDARRRARIVGQLEALGVEQVRSLIGTGALPTEWNPIIVDWLKGQGGSHVDAIKASAGGELAQLAGALGSLFWWCVKASALAYVIYAVIAALSR